MKKIISIIIAICSMTCLNAQVMRIYKDGQVINEYEASEVDSVVYYNANVKSFTVNGVSFNMVCVKAGSYTGENGLVTITKDYYIGETEVTQDLWEAIMGSNPSYHQGNKYPVEQVSWSTIKNFIEKLNEASGLSFRLPYEAEWDFAARGGNYSHNYTWSGSNNYDEVAWVKENSAVDGVLQSHEVATKKPNELGLYDMSGNLWEWCEDWYQSSYPSGTDPFNPTTSQYSKVTRDGSYEYDASSSVVSKRWYYYNGYRLGGFRLALSIEE